MRSTAELYDWELHHLHHRVDQDVGFYRALARALDGPVLELGCGTGRVTAHLPDAVGLDIDLEMLRVARSRGVDRVVQADMRAFAFTSRFAVVAIPYNSLQLLLDDAGIVASLRCAADHLLPHGVVAFEVTDFPAEDDVEPAVLAEADGVVLAGSLRVDHERDVLHYRRRFEEGDDAYEDTISLRRSGASNAEHWVRAAGLTVVSADWVGLGLRVVARTTIPA